MTGTQLRSWGNYPPFPQTPLPCRWRSDLEAVLSRAKGAHGTTLPHGSGRSYGDSCLAASDHVLHTRSLDRFIDADWSTGIIKAEAGVNLEEVLAAAIPHGWFLPVTPGTKYATLGGAVANDVHGKNHHRQGTFGRHVDRLGLLRSDSGRAVCSAQENPDLFSATIGGLGLTGVIEWVEIRLQPIRSSQIHLVTQRFDNLDDFFDLSDELEAQHEFCVSWIDCAAKGQATGRGVYMAGDFASEGPLSVASTRKLTIPIRPPLSLINKLTLRAFNQVHWRKAPAVRSRSTIGYDPFFYPLDAILKWNRIYGPNGFQQFQALVPEHEARDGIRALLSAISASGAGSFLAVLKRCGTVSSPGLLSFPRPGTTLALDFPQTTHLVSDLLPRLDAILREAGGRLYPAKDAHWSGEDFRNAYPEWIRLESLRDPALMSRFWKRILQ